MSKYPSVAVAVALFAPALALADSCPLDPLKTEPGLCGCGVADSDWDVDGEADSCIDPGATVPVGTTVGYRARIDAGAVIGTGVTLGAYTHVGAGSNVGNNTVIGSRATVGDATQLGINTVVSRRATIGSNVTLGPEAMIGRAASIPDDLTVSGVGFLTVGYGTTLGTSVQTVGENTTLGNLVDMDAASIGDDVTVARGTQVGLDAVLETGVIIGPDSHILSQAVIAAGARLRKDVDVGARSRVGPGSRIGRSVDIAADACIGDNVRVGANSTVEMWADIAEDSVIARGTTVAGEAAQPECGSSFGTSVRFVAATDTIRTPVNTNLSTNHTIEARVFLDPYDSGLWSIWNEWTNGQEDKALIARPGYLYGYGYPRTTSIAANTPSVQDGQWHHVAFVTQGAARYLFLDGQIVAQDALGVDPNEGAGLGYLGGIARDGGLRDAFRGYLDCFRLSNVARYTAPFTPPAGDMASDANTIMLFTFAPEDFYDDNGTIRVKDRGPLYPNGNDGELATGFGTATAPLYPQ